MFVSTCQSVELRRRLLSYAAVSTAPLSLVDRFLPVGVLSVVMWKYLEYFRLLTGARAIELYATRSQEAAIDRLGLRERVVAYHVPWEKRVLNLERLVNTPHRQPITATVHAYEWACHFHYLQTGEWLSESSNALAAFVARKIPTEAELLLLDQAAENRVIILFETVVDRELYGYLAAINQLREVYLFRRLEYVHRLRERWLRRHPDQSDAPVGVVFNPWHIAMEARGPQIRYWLQQGWRAEAVRDFLLLLLERYYCAAEGLVRRFYVGNSRPWELRLPEMLQRGHFLDPAGVVPELELLQRALYLQPELAHAVTLEAAPQSAVFSGRLALRYHVLD